MILLVMVLLWILPMRGPVKMPQNMDTPRFVIVLRFDDVTENTNLSLLRNLLAAVNSVGAKITLGVIPEVGMGDLHRVSTGPYLKIQPTGELAELLRDSTRLGFSEVAIHGLHHTFWKEDAWTEFAGRPPSEQIGALQEGVTILETSLNLTPTVFIPPWNTFDQNTTKACKKLKMTISAGYGQHWASSAGNGVDYLHANVDGVHAAIDALSMDEAAKQDPKLLVIVLHEYNLDVKGIAALQSSLASVRGHSDVSFGTIGETVEKHPELVKANLEAAVRLLEANHDSRPVILRSTLTRLGIGISSRMAQARTPLRKGDILGTIAMAIKIRLVQWVMLAVAVILLVLVVEALLATLGRHGNRELSSNRKWILTCILFTCAVITSLLFWGEDASVEAGFYTAAILLPVWVSANSSRQGAAGL